MESARDAGGSGDPIPALTENGELERLADRALVGARDEARQLGPWSEPKDLPAPTSAIRERIEQALDDFTSNTIAKMVPIARILRATLPALASHGS